MGRRLEQQHVHHRKPNRLFFFGVCDPEDLSIIPLTTNNQFYAPGARITIRCDLDDWSLSEAQAQGIDVGSAVNDTPTIDQIVAWGHAVLGF